MNNKIKLVFLCTGNSCRSQMAEGWTRHLKGDLIEVFSAGIETHGLNSNAVKVMMEAGVDISDHHSKHIDSLKNESFDYVITVCDNANETCPYFPANCKIIHKSFEDPPKTALNLKDKNEILNCYRKVREEIKNFVETLPDILN